MKIGAVVLAAGSSSRLGQPKQLLTHGGTTLVRLSARAALGAGCSPVIVVLGSGREKIATALAGLAVEIVWNEQWERGLGSSLRAGLVAAADCDAVVIMACDQPHVSPRLLRALCARQEETQRPMVASSYAGTIGVPALFTRASFGQLLSLGDDAGAKTLLTAQPNDVALVEFARGAIDIDTQEDLSALEDSQEPSP